MVAPVQDDGVQDLPDRVRRRLDEVFGDVLPTTTSDERDDRLEQGDGDAELLANRPPHHDQD
jgi:hypothetical protein